MRLPNSEQAWVPREKITGYLLVREHEDGGSKANRFSKLGFTIERWETLAQALLIQGASHEVNKVESDRYGIKYVVEGNLDTPSGEAIYVRSVWQVKWGTEYPRLITAYPIRRS